MRQTGHRPGPNIPRRAVARPQSLQAPFQLTAFGGRQVGENALDTDPLEHFLLAKFFNDAIDPDLLDDAIDPDLFDDAIQPQAFNGRADIKEPVFSLGAGHGFDLLPG